MAITAKIRMSGEEVKTKTSLTPEEIRDRLFYFHDAAHEFHQQTKGGWEHDALGKLVKLVKELLDFSYELYEFACEKKLLDVENRSQELSGLAAKTIYRLTLS